MSATSDYWLSRFIYCLTTAVTAWIALADDTSKHNLIFGSDGYGGTIAVGAMLFLAILGVWDIFLDQVVHVESRAYMRWKRKRFLLYLILAGAHGSLLYASLARWIVEAFIARYAVDTLCGLIIAVLLVKRRHTAYKTTLG